LNLPKDRELFIVDIGCGGGDGMIAMQQFLQKKGIKARMMGLDANEKAIEYAKIRCKNHPDFIWECKPFQEVDLKEADVIHCCLFAHHFYEGDLKALVRLLTSAKLGFVVNDLHRHWFAYHSISILSQLFSRSYLLKNDARLSVAKGFSKQELVELFSGIPVHDLNIAWKWAFRWQVTGRTLGI